MVEKERWVMHGLNADDPNCIKSVEQLQAFIEEIGFLPLFRNEIPGFSVEEHTAADSWWSEDPESDPWEWRKNVILMRGEKTTCSVINAERIRRLYKLQDNR
jgi:hypothetical protein